MDRRRFVAQSSLLGLSMASTGCLVRSDEVPTTEAGSTETRITPSPADPIQIEFVDDVGRSVTVRITRGDQTFLDVSETISSDYRAFDSGIRSTGTYELFAAFEDGPEATTDLTIEPYDVRMGSNVTVEIRDGEIEFWIEE